MFETLFDFSLLRQTVQISPKCIFSEILEYYLWQGRALSLWVHFYSQFNFYHPRPQFSDKQQQLGAGSGILRAAVFGLFSTVFSAQGPIFEL